MTWPAKPGTPRDWTDGELVLGRYLNDILHQMDWIQGSYPGQTQIGHGLGIRAPHFGAQSTASALELRRRYTTGKNATVRMVGRKAYPLTGGDSLDLLFAVGNTAGTRENLVLLRWKRTAANKADIAIWLYSGGSLAAAPSLILCPDGRGGSGTVGPGAYALDVVGHINAVGFEGMSIWGESPAGTQRHGYDAEVTGDWISTVVTGTAPIVAPTQALIRRLNASLLHGVAWPSAASIGTGSAAISTPGTDYTVAQTTTDRAGLHIIQANATVEVDEGDEAARFTLTGTGRTIPARGKGKTARQRFSLSARWRYQATASETISALVRKVGGTGSSMVTGRVRAKWIGN